MAESYLSTAHFQDVAFTSLVKAMFSVHNQAPPLTLNLRVTTEAMPNVDRIRVEEHIVAPGATVTAIGRYVSATNSIVGGSREGGYLRLYAGTGPAQSSSAFPWKAVRSVIVGLLIVAAANGGLWWFLRVMPR